MSKTNTSEESACANPRCLTLENKLRSIAPSELMDTSAAKAFEASSAANAML